MSSGFIKETELAEQKKKRQEEWEKIRKPDEPLIRPEEQLDSRPLYERLKEQKMKKDLEYEEAHKLKNLIRGLDDDEVEFLDFVDRTKMKAEKKQQIEDEKELIEFRKKVAQLQGKKLQSESLIPQKRKLSIFSSSRVATLRQSQKSIITAVIRKRKDVEPLSSSKISNKIENQTNHNNYDKNEIKSCNQTVVDHKTKSEENCNKTIIEKNKSLENGKDELNKNLTKLTSAITITSNNSLDKGALKCIGIYPSVGVCNYYEKSSDSDEDFVNNSKSCEYDLVGRKFYKKSSCENE